MKNLPNVTPFAINKKIDNTQERYYSAENYLLPKKKINVIAKINEIFASNSHVYKSRVRIKLKDDLQERTIVGKTGSELLTLSGEKIKIADIIDIEKV